MLSKKIRNLKEILLKKTEGDNKKNIENLVVFLILLIITIIAINMIWGKEEKINEEPNSSYKKLANTLDNNITSNNSDLNEYNLEQELEDILSKLSGVGKVKILITYSQTSEIIPMYNESTVSSNTEETDTNGGIRKIESTDSSKQVVFEEKDGTSIPITKKTSFPKVEGAIIVAEGGGNAIIKTNIIQAVSAVTGIATYKVQVFEMED